jgi:riboflavin synthase
MFTGIIQAVGSVADVRGAAAARAIRVRSPDIAADAAVGQSVNVDGCCLTVTAVEGECLAFDVGAETLRLTTLGALGRGDRVNLEPALRIGDRLGGHFVQGHVDGVGTIRRKEALPGEVRLEVAVERRLSREMILKGSLAVDGISLTIAALRDDACEMSLIPHTIAATTLRDKGPGDRVNVECDLIGRWVRKLLSGEPAAGLSVRDLEEQGF